MNPAELPFPLKGVHLGTEYELQPPLTAAGGSNVRAEDALGRRLRGGSRPGQAKYIDARVGGIDGPVQHLNYVVDPTTAALLTKFEQDDAADNPGDYVPDPSTNNASGGSTDPDTPGTRNPSREVPDGGSGVPPDPDVGQEGGDGGNPPTARADTATAVVGGPPVEIDVLANDDYVGTPTITISSGPTGALTYGSSAEVTGAGAASRLVYTPGAEGEGYDDEVGYRLSATGNGGTSGNLVRITVSPAGGGDPDDGTVIPSFSLYKAYSGVTPEWYYLRVDFNKPVSTATLGYLKNLGTGQSIPFSLVDVYGTYALWRAAWSDAHFTDGATETVEVMLSTAPQLSPSYRPATFQYSESD